MNRTGLPIAAGTINIIAGFFNIMGCLGMLCLAFWVSNSINNNYDWHSMMPYASGNWDGFRAQIFLFIVSGWLLVSGILAIIGGAFALQRKYWGFALAGSIFVLLTSFALGVASLILVIVSMKEFNNEQYEPMMQTIMPHPPYDQNME